MFQYLFQLISFRESLKLLLFVFLTNALFAVDTSFEIRLGYAQFMDTTVQDIYGPGAPDVEIEGDFKITPLLGIWGNLNCIWESGRSIGTYNATDLSMKTLSSGVKMLFFEHHPCLKVYLGLGVLGTYFYVNNHIPPVLEETYRWGAGLVGKLGFHYCFKDGVFLSPFLDYYYQPLGVETSNVLTFGNIINLGGFRMGLGLGRAF